MSSWAIAVPWPNPEAIGLDGVQVWGPVYQGALPPTGAALGNAGMRAIVVCAAEICPSLTDDSYPGVAVHRCPLFDEHTFVHAAMWLEIELAAEFVKRCVNGDVITNKSIPVLIACQQGKNRSALVTAAAVHLLTNCSGLQAYEMLKACSPRTFSNPYFAAAIQGRWP